MINADQPIQRHPKSKLLVAGRDGSIRHAERGELLRFLRPADLVVANNAATIPASLHGLHCRTNAVVEVRLAARGSLAPSDLRFRAVVFGAGDFRMRTEDRPFPPLLAEGDRLEFGPLAGVVENSRGHPRLAWLRFENSPDDFWAGLARFGRPIQYSHLRAPLALWDVWTRIAGPPVAFEAPSAGFVLDWELIQSMRARGIAFVTVTHAAGISSTGDPELDRLLPLDEAYDLPAATVHAIRRVRDRGGRIVAIGTSVVRALESAAAGTGNIRSGQGLARGRIGPSSRLRVVDAILSGTHEPDTSHYQLLRAFVDDDRLDRIGRELEEHQYRTHEFGDSVLIECAKRDVFRAADTSERSTDRPAWAL